MTKAYNWVPEERRKKGKQMDHTGLQSDYVMLLNTAVETRKLEVVTVLIHYLHVHVHKTNLFNLNCLFSTSESMRS
jgi:hypothetical protein